MIHHCSRHVLMTEEYTFDVERTPGGHFVMVTSADGRWRGIYCCDVTLQLRARCRAEPPRELILPHDIHERLASMIASMHDLTDCGSKNGGELLSRQSSVIEGD